MSDAVPAAGVLRDAADPTVDGALRNWRAETDRRRAAYQEAAHRHNAAQQARRAKLFRGLATGGALAGVLGGLAFLVIGSLGRSAPAVAPTFAAVVPTLGVEGIERPVREVSVPESSHALGIVGDVLTWSRTGDLWIQLDYTGDPMTLRWKDAAGVEALESTVCTNRLPGGLSRCYLARTGERVAVALAGGAAPGTWTVEGCQSGGCTEVASFEVR